MQLAGYIIIYESYSLETWYTDRLRSNQIIVLFICHLSTSPDSQLEMFKYMDKYYQQFQSRIFGKITSKSSFTSKGSVNLLADLSLCFTPVT